MISNYTLYIYMLFAKEKAFAVKNETIITDKNLVVSLTIS